MNVHKSGRLIDTLRVGDCFGEMGYISGRQRTASIRTAEASTIMKVQSSLIERASLNCQLRFHKFFLYTLIDRLARATDRIAMGPDPGTSTA